MAVIEKQTTRIQEHHKLILKNLTLTIILFTIFLHLCHYLSCSNGVRFITHRAIVPSPVFSSKYVNATRCIQVDMHMYVYFTSTRKHVSHNEISIPVQVRNEWCLAMCNRRLCMRNTWHNGPCCSGDRRLIVLFLPYLSGETTGLFDTSSKTSVQ